MSLDLALKTVKKAGYTVIKTTKWYITGRGQVMEMGRNDKTEERSNFLGSYDTKEQAEHARDQVKLMFGDK